MVSARIAAKMPGSASALMSVFSSQAMPTWPFFADSARRVVTAPSSAVVTSASSGTCISNR